MYSFVKSHRCARTGLIGSVLAASLSLAGSVFADQHTAGTPQLSSDPGAPFTLYLDPNGFDYTGTWGTSGKSPGDTPSYDNVAANGTFSAADVQQIDIMFATVAQNYAGFNINVTTVDPAVAAGQGGTDAARQAYYDATPNVMHMVIGAQARPAGTPGVTAGGNWYSDAADGVSGIGVIDGVGAYSGSHTNWMFSDAVQTNGAYVGQIASHENGHALGLAHQSDYTGATLVNEYALGDTANGNGTYTPIMGQADGKQRTAWRSGDSDNNDPSTEPHVNFVAGRGITTAAFVGPRAIGADGAPQQNDVGKMLSLNTAATVTANGGTGGADLHLTNDGIGHTLANATALTLAGTTINPALAKGVIVPVTEVGPQPIGAGNYTSDFFKFTLASTSNISLTVHDASEFITAGVADSIGSLRSTLSILNAAGMVIGTGIEDASTLFETYANALAAGTYELEVNSFGGHLQVNANTNAGQNYYDMGSYFITGDGFNAVPEPGTWVMLVGGALLLVVTFRRRTA